MSESIAWEERPAGTCRGCGDEIRWVKFPASGKSMPVDAEPSSAGDVAVDVEGNARKVGQGYSGDRYVSHFVTCARRDEFRKS